MPADDLALLTAAAAEAGRIALRFWRQAPEAWDKPDGAGPVSAADLAVNAMLAETLRAARPGYGWLSEEDADDPARLECERVFVIDPIDGTRAFLDGQPQFAVSLAVAARGAVTAAVVHLPALGATYAAAAGGKATKDGVELRATGGTGQVLASAAALAPEHWPGGAPQLRRAFRASLAHRLCLVAEGAFDAMLTLRPTWEWDAAAGCLIAEAAGARVTDWHGGSLAFNRPVPRLPGLVAAPAACHAELLARRRGPG